MKSLKKNFIKYVSLNIAGMLGMSCYILADTFFVASALGQDGLAALNFSISVFTIMQGIGLLIGIGGATGFSILKAAPDSTRQNEMFVNSLVLGAAASVIFLTTAVFFAEPLSILLGADKTTLPLTKVYLTTILAFSPFFIFNNILLAFIRNDGNPKLSMAAMIISSLSNVILDYVFMFPMSMGIFGAAFATGISPVISLCILSIHFISKKNGFHICRCNISFSKIKNIFLLGFSSFIGEMASAIALIIFNLVILRIEGNTGVAAYGIVANLALIATAIFTGTAQGLQPLASEFHGKNDTSSIKLILKYSVYTVFVISLCIYISVFFFSDQITAVFNSKRNVLLGELASRGMKIYFLGFLFAGLNIICSSFLSSIQRPKYAIIISVLRSFALLVPSIIILSLVFGMTGVWLSFAVTEFIVFLFCCCLLYKIKDGNRSSNLNE